MRRTFKYLLVGALLSLIVFGFSAASANPEVPAEVFSSSKLTLKNREVVREKNLLFTRVDMKPLPGVSASILESQASLFALRNFAAFSFRAAAWDQLRSETEQKIALGLFQRSRPSRATVTGLTPVQKTASSDTLTFIYAAHAPPDGANRIHEQEIIASIKEALRLHPELIDFLSYLELALRKPALFDAKPAVKGLAKSFGENFPLFLLGLDVPGSDLAISQTSLNTDRLAAADRDELALLLGRMPYHPVLALRFAESLLADSHEEVARLAIAGSGRLSKNGPVYERALAISRQLKTELSGAYRHPVPGILLQRVADEMVKARIELPPCLEAILLSLGDLPLQPEKRNHSATSGGSMPNSAEVGLENDLKRLMPDADSCKRPEILEAIGDLFAETGFPHLAFCFFNQSAGFEPENSRLRGKLRSAAESLGIGQYLQNAHKP